MATLTATASLSGAGALTAGGPVLGKALTPAIETDTATAGGIPGVTTSTGFGIGPFSTDPFSTGRLVSTAIGGTVGTYPGAVGSGALGDSGLGDAVLGGGSAAPLLAAEADSAMVLRPTGSYPTATAADVNLALPLVSVVSNQAYIDAIEDIDRVPLYTFKADWSRTGRYDHALSDMTDVLAEATVDRQIEGELPAEVGIVEGSAAASLQATIAGEWGVLPTDDDIKLVEAVGASISTFGTVPAGSVATPGTLTISSASFSPAAGELLLVKALGSLHVTALPTSISGGGLTWTPQLAFQTPGQSVVFFWTAVATSSAPMSVSVTYRNTLGDGSVGRALVGVERWANATVATTPVTSVSGALTAAPYLQTITTTVDRSVVSFVDGDFLGVNAAATYAAGATAVHDARYAGNLSYHSAYLSPAPAGTRTMQVIAPTGQRATIAGIELLPAKPRGELVGVDPVDAFAPYRPDMPFYRMATITTPCYLETGFATREGPRTQRRFTGSISRINPSSARRDVQLDALDGANKLRAPITLRANGLDGLLLKRYGPSLYSSKINSQWLIDRILRENGIYASPPPVAMPSPRLSVTLHGSTIPEAVTGTDGQVIEGYGGVPQEHAVSPVAGDAWINTGHPNGMLYPNPAALPMTGKWTSRLGPGNSVGWATSFSMWIRLPSSASVNGTFLTINTGQDSRIFLWFSNGTLNFWYTFAEGGSSVTYQVAPKPTADQWVFLTGSVAITDTTHFTMRWRITMPPGQSASAVGLGSVAGVTGTSGSVSNGLTLLEPAFAVNQYEYNLNVPVTNLVVGWSPNTNPLPADQSGYVSQADLDPGANQLWGIPDVHGEDSWTLLKEIVAAELGGVGFDENGRFWFRSRSVNRARSTREVITATKNLADLVTVTDEAAVRNSITTTTARPLIGDWEPIYKPQEPREITIGTGVTIYDLPLPEGTVITFGAGQGGLVRPAWADTTTSPGNSFTDYAERYDFRDSIIFAAVRDANPVIDYLTDFPAGDQITFSVWQTSPTTMRLWIYNNSGLTYRLAMKSTFSGAVESPGQAALQIPGRKLITESPQTTQITDQGSIQIYGPRTFQLASSGSRWHQDPDAAAGLASGVLATTGQPIPILDQIEVPHDPRRKLYGDVMVVDERGLGSVPGTISGITTTYRPDGVTDKLTVRPVTSPGLGILDDPEFGAVGSTLIFGA